MEKGILIKLIIRAERKEDYLRITEVMDSAFEQKSAGRKDYLGCL